jgi:transcription elongation factor GreB
VDTSNLITPSGYRELQRELEALWKQERPRVTREVAEAAALGDRSENAEYIYGKRRLREIDKRLEFLSKRLDNVKVVDPSTIQDQARVGFGAWVDIEDEEGACRRYQIVGTDEFDADAGKISVRSPIARALLGKRVDDEALVQRPSGEIAYVITGIQFPTSDGAA